MHACGHDGHMALGLGLAALLTAPGAAPLRQRVRLLFQPAEEGVRGAASMIAHVAGARHFLAVHIGLGAPRSGDLVTGVGAFLATSKFDVRFTGRAAHAGAAPEQGRDALKGAASALLGLHALPRHGHGTSRICVGRLEGGSTWWAARLRRRATRPSRTCWPAAPGNCRPMPGAEAALRRPGSVSGATWAPAMTPRS